MESSELCLQLMHADSEDAVVAILEAAGYWDDPAAWRYLGDSESNFSSIGNQQSESIAALVEKIVNGVDARLINACHEAGLDPESPAAPTSIREAVATFFEGRTTSDPDRDGKLAHWGQESHAATREGRLLTLAATGHKPGEGRPCLTIADQGEGQTPDSFPLTFMSLGRSNKLRIHFVQGKFNMGGTGALNFCSEHHRLQLVVSRRNPALLPRGAADRDHEWGFTVVRRQAPELGARSTVYTFLAPTKAEEKPKRGEVLSFKADTWPIFPEDPQAKNQGAEPYARHALHGSLVKLYEYEWQGVKSNIVLSGEGLLRRIDLALPELALPVRLFECRPYGGGSASFSTNALGLLARLDEDKADNLEPSFPVGASITLDSRQIAVRVYAFRPEKAKQYRLSRYGVVFAVNGQMHAAFPIDFFNRKAVNLSYIGDSLLVVLDCSNMDELMREDLFMNSRDRLRDTPLARRLEEELERYLKDEQALRALQNQRRAARTADRLKDDKPLADVLQGLLKSNPLLSNLFRHGVRLSAPFPPTSGEGAGTADSFEGRDFPTFFRFKGRQMGAELSRPAHHGSRVRIAFETDAVDEYFVRETSPGAWRIRAKVGNDYVDVPDWTSTGPRSGIAQLWINSLPIGAALGSTIEYLIEVTDDSRIEAFSNALHLQIVQQGAGSGGTGSRTRAANRGRGNQGGDAQFALPPITPVRKEKWSEHSFDENTALVVKLANDDSADVTDSYDFFVNIDNQHLRIAQKETRTDVGLLEKQFTYGMVLVGLALLQNQRAERRGSVEPSVNAMSDEAFISKTTRALAPVFLPMMDALGGLSADEAVP